jgi:hypothetical protein
VSLADLQALEASWHDLALDGYLKDGFVVDTGAGCDSDVGGNADENDSDDDDNTIPNTLIAESSEIGSKIVTDIHVIEK